jgi:hypothetical protein
MLLRRSLGGAERLRAPYVWVVEEIAKRGCQLNGQRQFARPRGAMDVKDARKISAAFRPY